MANKPNIVLVHGAWADGSNWSKVIPPVAAAGYTVVSSQHPLTSLTEDAEIVRRLAESLEGPTILVGHSYGGAVITEAALQCPNVTALVFIAAFAPDTGENLGGLLGRTEPSAGGAAIRPDKYGTLWIDRALFGEAFAQDCEKPAIQLMATAQKPIAGKCFEDKPTKVGWKDLPCWYQVSEKDRMIPPVTQHFMAERMKATILSLDSSHASLVSHAKAVGDFIIKAAEAVASSTKK